MLSLVIKNFILAVLIALILHFLLKNHMIEISEHTHLKKKESFVSSYTKGILKSANDGAVKKAKKSDKTVKFDEKIESYNNFDLGDIYTAEVKENIPKYDNTGDINNINDINDINYFNADLNNKKIKDDLYEFVFNKQTEFGEASIDPFSANVENKKTKDDLNSVEDWGELEKDSIKEFNNDSFLDKKSDEIFDGIIGYRESGNFSIL